MILCNMYILIQFGQCFHCINIFCEVNDMVMRCPNCNGRDIGKIGSQNYYCWTCFIEMTVIDNELTVHQIETDGSLSSLNDLFSEDELRLQ